MLLSASAAELGLLVIPSPETGELPLVERLTHRHMSVKGKSPKPGDVESWKNSIPVVVRALLDAGLGEVHALIEYDMPHTNSAADLVLCGVRPGTEDVSYVVVELKQTREATVRPDFPTAAHLGYSKYKLHPVRQVQSYCAYLQRYLPLLAANPERLAGVALLHNAERARVAELAELPATIHGTLYTSDDLPEFGRMLASRLSPRPGREAARLLREARRKPLPKLTDIALSRTFQGGGLVLLDEQLWGADRVISQVKEALEVQHSGQKKVFVFRGGPGSGKSAVALELQRATGLLGHRAVLASGSHAYTETLRAVYIGSARKGEVARKKRAAADLYRYFNRFGEVEPDSIDVLICDEAHRIRRTSTNRYTRKELREKGQAQADELLRAARVPVFLLDDHQSIRPDEVGELAYLRDQARGLGYEVVVNELRHTFRAGGSSRYQTWVQRLLGMDVIDPEPWEPDGKMVVLAVETPEEMEEFVKARTVEGYSARMTAGYCWPWSKPDGQDLVPDVRIGAWERPWNVKPEHSVRHAPVSDRWATDPRGVDQIGCVYTAQTFEYEWNAVIIGPDLVWRDGRFVVDRTASRDPGFKRSESGEPVDETAVDRCIRNAYHVLLTRGMVGTLLYSTDSETRQALRRLTSESIGREHVPGPAPNPLTAEGNALPPAYRRIHG